jgi:hypothetical protein
MFHNMFQYHLQKVVTYHKVSITLVHKNICAAVAEQVGVAHQKSPVVRSGKQGRALGQGV